ncbi:hypothetical protein INR49_026288 [Caranx melampygus]|nr:hypothetical protein INR49_026288 [Caranx melampygus]
MVTCVYSDDGVLRNLITPLDKWEGSLLLLSPLVFDLPLPRVRESVLVAAVGRPPPSSRQSEKREGPQCFSRGLHITPCLKKNTLAMIREECFRLGWIP